MENKIMIEMLEEMKKQNSALYTTLAELVNNQLSGMQTILSKADVNHEQTRTDTNEEKDIIRESTQIDANKNGITLKEIKGHLYLNNVKPTQIAKELKCTPASISRILSGQSKSKRIAGFIAKRIGYKREEIFGY